MLGSREQDGKTMSQRHPFNMFRAQGLQCRLQMKSLRQNQILHKSFPRPHLEALQANQIQHINVAQNLLLGTSASAGMFSPLPNPFYRFPNVLACKVSSFVAF